MCLALPMRITAVADDGTATLALEGLEQRASLALLPEAAIGDFVLVHAGLRAQRAHRGRGRGDAHPSAELAECAAAEDEEAGGRA